jgi:hypothetical protein
MNLQEANANTPPPRPGHFGQAGIVEGNCRLPYGSSLSIAPLRGCTRIVDHLQISGSRGQSFARRFFEKLRSNSTTVVCKRSRGLQQAYVACGFRFHHHAKPDRKNERAAFTRLAFHPDLPSQ